MIPAQAPRVIIAVSIDRPRKGSHFGGAVSGPVFSRIGYDVMRILNVVPDDPSTQFACDQCGTS